MHLRQLIQEQNRLSSAKAAIGSDELIAIVFLDMAGEEVRSIVASAYQTEAPQHTAFPISLLNKELLQPAFPNPANLGCVFLICTSFWCI